MKHQLCVFLFSLNLIVVFFFGTKLQFQTILSPNLYSSM